MQDHGSLGEKWFMCLFVYATVKMIKIDPSLNVVIKRTYTCYRMNVEEAATSEQSGL